MRPSFLIIAGTAVALTPAVITSVFTTTVFITPARAQGTADPASLGKQVSATCAACHGAQGEGQAASNFPRIAGQGEGYLARQLMLYADGTRSHPVMSPIAKGLTREQIDAVSLYYAGMQAPAPRQAAPTGDQSQQRGRQLANVGDDSVGVQSCANCHGPGGIGQPPNYPYLASQYSGYLVTTLTDFKKGTRKTDMSRVMNVLATKLSDADIKAVSGYYAMQAPPVPAAQRMNVAAGSAMRPAAPGGGPTVQPSAPVEGIGSEQGAPTTGGGQGPGGGGGASGTGPQGIPRTNAPGTK